MRLTNSPGVSESEPTWSPDGKKIVFYATPTDPSLSPYISVINADGTGLVKLSFPADPPMGLKWSPDSQYLAYIIGYPLPKETWGAWVVKADGTSGEVVLKIEQPGVGT